MRVRFLSRTCCAPSLRSNPSTRREFADVVSAPVRRTVTPDERAALRAARKARTSPSSNQAPRSGDGGQSSNAAQPSTIAQISASRAKYVWYLGLIVPTGLLAWGYNDENSPPAKFSEMIGLTGIVESFAEEFAKPAHEKLLPDWNQVRIISIRHNGSNDMALGLWCVASTNRSSPDAH